MVNLEKESKKKKRRQNIQKIVLGTIAVAGILPVALVAPNAIQYILGGIGGRRKPRQWYSVGSSTQRLIRKGLILFEKTKAGTFVRLTEKGQRALQFSQIAEHGLPSPKRWDGKWRILIFDIPERRRLVRSKIRTTLMAWGFARLQDSVWIYPHDCEDYVTLLKADFKIGKDLLYLIVDSLENDARIRKQFKIT